MSNYEFLESFLNFGKPVKLVFNSNVKDMNPAHWEKTEDGYKGTFKTLGINPEDVKIEMINEYGQPSIKIEGKTEMEGYTYDTSFQIPISQEVSNSITKIQKASKNGITIIKLINKTKTPAMLGVWDLEYGRGMI